MTDVKHGRGDVKTLSASCPIRSLTVYYLDIVKLDGCGIRRSE